MNILNRIKNTVSKIITTDSILNLSNQDYALTDDIDDTSLQLNYKDSLYLNRGLSIIRETVSSINFKLYEITSTKGESKEIEVHEILDLLYKPNPIQTRTELMRLVFTSFKLSGECFIRILFSDSNYKKPIALVHLKSTDITVKYNTDNDGKLTYELAKNDGTKVVLQAQEIIHMKDPDLNNPLRGYSQLRPILSRVEAEIEAVKYQKGIFARNGNPDGVLTVKGVQDQTLLNKLKQSFLNSFTGKNERSKVAVISGDATYTSLSQSSTSVLDYDKSLKLTRDDILTALGVPLSLIKTDDVNRANADAGLQQFMKHTIKPMFELFVEVINERFIIPIYGEKYYLDTEKIVTEDRELLLKEAQAGTDKWFTANEIRARYGYEPLDGSDVLKEAYGFTPQMVQNALKTRPNLYRQLKIQETKEELVKVLTRKNFVNKLSGDPVFKTQFSNAVNEVRDNAEKRTKTQAKKYFAEQRDRILSKLKQVGDNFTTAGDVFDIKAEKEEARKFIMPLYVKNSVDAGNVALIPVKMAHNKANAFSVTSNLVKKLEARAKLFSDSVGDTTYNLVSEVIGANVNLGVDEVSKLLKEKLDLHSTVRADLIARTESAYMTSLGTQEAYSESDFVVGKEWLSSQDSLVRPEHVANDGVIVDKDGIFPSGESFPAEDSFNCRCTIAPVVKL